MFKKKQKKGFTIVELVIVIAVIAILSAVLIPTFAGLINKANISADKTLVRNLNTSLAISSEGGTKNPTMYQTLEAMKEQGYVVDKLTPTSTGSEIVWDSGKNQFVLIMKDKKGNTEYYTGTEFDDYKNVEKSRLWKIYKTLESSKDSEYSIYLAGDEFTGTVEVSGVGFDAGLNKISVHYKNETKSKDVVIRTNGGNLTVDGFRSLTANSEGKFDGDIVRHYGWLDTLVINSVGDLDCYHEYGFVGRVDTFSVGKFVAESGSKFHQTKTEVENVIGSNEKNLEKAEFEQHKFNENGVCVIEGCGYSSPEHQHAFIYTDNKDGKSHKITCKTCSYSEDESHIFNQYGKCTKCSYERKIETLDFDKGENFFKDIANKILKSDDKVKEIVFDYDANYSNEIDKLTGYAVNQNNLEVAKVYWDGYEKIYILSPNSIYAPVDLSSMFGKSFRDYNQYETLESLYLFNFNLASDKNYTVDMMFYNLPELKHIYVKQETDWSNMLSNASSYPIYECPNLLNQKGDKIFESKQWITAEYLHSGAKTHKNNQEYGFFTLLGGLKFDINNLILSAEKNNADYTGLLLLQTTNGAEIDYENYTYEFETKFVYGINGNYDGTTGAFPQLARVTFNYTQVLDKSNEKCKYVNFTKNADSSGEKITVPATIFYNSTSTSENKDLELYLQKSSGAYSVSLCGPGTIVDGANNIDNPQNLSPKEKIHYSLIVRDKNGNIVREITGEQDINRDSKFENVNMK